MKNMYAVGIHVAGIIFIVLSVLFGGARGIAEMSLWPFWTIAGVGSFFGILLLGVAEIIRILQHK